MCQVLRHPGSWGTVPPTKAVPCALVRSSGHCPGTGRLGVTLGETRPDSELMPLARGDPAGAACQLCPSPVSLTAGHSCSHQEQAVAGDIHTQ